MKYILSTILLIPVITNSQIINKSVNQASFDQHANLGIVVSDNLASITSSAVYRAKPDGYRVLFTTSFIGQSMDQVEKEMNTNIDALISSLKSFSIRKKEVTVDLISLDPIFATAIDHLPESPIGYKITQNIQVNIKDFNLIRPLAKRCMEFDIYDLVSIKPYLNNSSPILDTLSKKVITITHTKKKDCEALGWVFSGGKPNFKKYDNTFYPSSSYIKSIVQNNSIYMHDISQNSDINLTRNVRIDSYKSIDLDKVDFIFNASLVEPVIQFYAQIHYTYEIKEKKEKTANAEDSKEKVFYILDKDGNLKKFEF